MTENTDFEQLWNDAYAVYAEETRRDLKNDLVVIKLGSVDNLIAEIETGGAKFKNWRNRHGKLCSILSSVLQPVVAFGSVASEAVSASPATVASPVLAATLYLLKACEGVSDAYDWIVKVFSELEEFSDRIALYIKESMNLVMRKKVTAILVFFLKILGRSEQLISRGRFRQYLRVVFLGKDDKTKGLIDELNVLLKAEHSYLVALTYATGQATYATLQRTEDDVTKVMHKVDSLNLKSADAGKALSSIQEHLEASKERDLRNDDEKRFEDALETPALSRTYEIYADLRNRLISGTGTWLEKEPLFLEWSKQKIPILWIFGGPGSGKSHLSTWIISALEDLHRGEQGHLTGASISFFYVKENEAQLRDSNILLKTLAWQLADQDSLFKKHAIAACKSRRNIISAEDTWANLFLSYYQSTKNLGQSAILVIDGLDEASKSARETILGLLKDLLHEDIHGTRACIQVAIIGRITLKGDMDFQREESFIEVSRKNHDDINKYIEGRLEKIDVLRKLEQVDRLELRLAHRAAYKPKAPIVKRKLKERISQRADGVFLWAQLLLDQIQNKEVAEIERIMSNPPENLEDMIRHVFERLAAEEEDHEPVKKLLTWIAHSRRPLLFGEIEMIMGLPTRSPNLLLWDAFYGKFASIFHLSLPEGLGYDRERRDSEAILAGVNDNLSRPYLSHTAYEEDDIVNSALENSTEDSDSDTDDETKPFRFFDTEASIATDPNDSADLQTFHTYKEYQLKTEIAFAHQYFRDFLVPLQERRPMTLDINNRDAHTTITCACFTILGLHFQDTLETRYLVDYSFRNFVFHLESIDTTTLTLEEERTILHGLYWLFHEEAGALAFFNSPMSRISPTWDEIWATWIATETHTKTVRLWLGRSENDYEHYSEKQVVWMRAATQSTKKLLETWVVVLARKWLEKRGFDDPELMDKSEKHVQLMHGILSIDDEGVVNDQLKQFSFAHQDFSKIPRERLRFLADKAPNKDTPHWHDGIGWIYMIGNYTDEAVFHFTEALRLDPSAWLPKEGLARIYGAQKLYQQAVDMMEDSYRSLPKVFTWVGGFLLPHIAEWKLRMGDHNGAFEAARQAYTDDSTNPIAQVRYLEALDQQERPMDVIDTIKKLSEQWLLDDPATSCLVSLFVNGWNVFDLTNGWNVFDLIGRAYRAVGQPYFVMEDLNKALKYSLRSGHHNIRMLVHWHVASFKYRYESGCDLNEVIRICQAALKHYSSITHPNQTYKRYQGQVVDFLARLNYDCAVSSWKSGTNPRAYTSQLRDLATITATSTDEFEELFDFYGTGYASILWGRWLRDYNQVNPSVWKKCFRARILKEIEMLDDQDPSNDMMGLHSLSITLLHVGDEENAAAILAILFKPLEDSRTAQETRCQVKSSNTQPMTKAVHEPLVLNLAQEKIHDCDGDCLSNHLYSALYFCKICLGKKFCDQCIEKVKSTSLQYRECCKDHDWLQVWPIDQTKWEVAADQRNGNLVIKKTWLNDIRTKWL